MIVIRKYTKSLSNKELIEEASESSRCALCLDSHDMTSRKLNCDHVYHLNCLAALVKSKQNDSVFYELKQSLLCPICKEKWNSTTVSDYKKKQRESDFFEESKDIRT
jgi:late competence protein required for DNA uptake (superfamily II DNA/RNA helicase)